VSNIKFRVLIEQDEDGIFVAEVPTLPGCIAQGSNRKDALANAQEAIELYIESLEAHGEPIPPAITEEIIGIDI
jgi:predicted RNase H-like HicB family nuclease